MARKGRSTGSVETTIVDDLLSQLKTKTYIAQAQRGEEGGIWEIEPVDYTTFLEHPDYLGLNLYGWSDAQKEVLDAVEDFDNDINHIVLVCGKGGGKNFTVRVIFLYLVYKLLCMRNPHAYFGMPEQEFITFLNVAASADQASSAFFEPLKEYMRMAGPKAFKVFGFDPMVDIKEREVDFPKNIKVVSGHSQADSLEGKHVLVAVADEIDGTAFKKPDKMWSMLRSSSRSRFHGKEKIIAISYPRYNDTNGMIMRLFEQYQNLKSAKTFRFPTWEFNPNPNITRDTFASEFAQNPEEAECIYACNPPTATMDAFIKDKTRLLASMTKHPNRHPLVFPLPSDRFRINPMSEVEQYVNGVPVRLDPYNIEFQSWFKGLPDVEYIFVGDPGIGSVENGGDAYGICLGHREVLFDEYGKRITRPVVDMFFRFTGHMFAEKEIQLDAVKKLIIKLKEELGFNITVFSFDMWNSYDIKQWLRRRYGPSLYINTERKYVNYEDYANLRQRIFGEEPPSSGMGEKLDNGGLNYYYHPVVYTELSELKEIREKNKVDHPSDGSKDMTDPLASFVFFATRRFPHIGVEVSAGKLNTALAAAKTNTNGLEESGSELGNLVQSLSKLSRDLRQPPPPEEHHYGPLES